MNIFFNHNARKREKKRPEPSDYQESRVTRNSINCDRYQDLRELRTSELYETVQ